MRKSLNSDPIFGNQINGFCVGSPNHFFGAITILSAVLFNQTAHQAKLLFGITKCLQAAISRR